MNFGCNVIHENLTDQTLSGNTVVRTHIDDHTKEEPNTVLTAMRLTVSDAFPWRLAHRVVSFFPSE